jgi:FixJ family two-component response regulator
MKTIFMSGYAKSAVLPGAELDASVSFLSKPFSVRALLQKVEESLDEEFSSALPNERPFQENSFDR